MPHVQEYMPDMPAFTDSLPLLWCQVHMFGTKEIRVELKAAKVIGRRALNCACGSLGGAQFSLQNIDNIENMTMMKCFKMFQVDSKSLQLLRLQCDRLATWWRWLKLSEIQGKRGAAHLKR